jgi:hypothetical protein
MFFKESCAAVCCAFAAKPKEDSAQPQPVKSIPAADPDTFLRNSLRVGIFKCKLFDEFRFPFAYPDALTYTPDFAPGKRRYSFPFAVSAQRPRRG